MIQAEFRVGENDYALCVRGHAGYGDRGNDIICAGVSALVFALAGWLDDQRESLEALELKLKEGDACVRCRSGEAQRETRAAFDVALAGLLQIAMKYPGHVCLNIYPHQAGDSREQTANS